MTFARFDDYPIYESRVDEDTSVSTGIRHIYTSHGCRFCESDVDCYNCTAYCNR